MLKVMKQRPIICIVALLATLLLTPLACSPGRAQAATVPTVALTTSGNADWQITFDRGEARPGARCRVSVGNTGQTVPVRTTAVLIKGSTVRAGIYPVRVRCGTLVSPTVQLFAPRNQLNDLWTWLSNGSAGLMGY